MKEETIKSIINTIQFLGALGISAFAIVASVKAWVKERSIGAAKVIELVEADKKFTEDIQKLKLKDDEHAEAIDKLEKEYHQMMYKVFDYLKK